MDIAGLSAALFLLLPGFLHDKSCLSGRHVQEAIRISRHSLESSGQFPTGRNDVSRIRALGGSSFEQGTLARPT